MPITLNGTTGIVSPSVVAAINLPNGGPAFSAYLVGAQTPTSNTWTKVLIDTELWDTNSNFASSRFTPTVAGYYQINAAFSVATNTTTFAACYKNGTAFKTSTALQVQNGNQISCVVYLNGSTDYVELYVFLVSGSALANAASSQTWFDGTLVRAA
jgi:hypothetical protein